MQAPRKQFLAPAIINCIAAFFFAKRGLAHGDDTKKYFKPLTGQLVVLTATAVGHIIQETSKGADNIDKFEGIGPRSEPPTIEIMLSTPQRKALTSTQIHFDV